MKSGSGGERLEIFVQDSELLEKTVQIIVTLKKNLFKVIVTRPMAPVLTQVHLKVSEQEMLSFSVRKEISKNDNSLVVILLSKVVEANSFRLYSQFTN